MLVTGRLFVGLRWWIVVVALLWRITIRDHHGGRIPAKFPSQIVGAKVRDAVDKDRIPRGILLETE